MPGASVKYSLYIKNKSNQDNMMCVYADLPSTQSTNMTKLAWLVEPAGAGDCLEFQWSLDWGVFWKKTGNVPSSNATFKECQTYPANPRDGSHFSLEIANSQFVKLNTLNANGASGSIYIDAAANIGQGVVSTGVTLNGAPVAVVDAFPNSYYTFATHPTYWLAFGGFTKGKNVDISATNTPIKVEFQTGVYELYFELGQDSKFTQVPAW